MRTLAVKRPTDLRRRFVAFFNVESQKAVGDFIGRMCRVGTVCVFGGFLRDLSLLGRRGFRSDIDIVFRGIDDGIVSKIVGSHVVTTNKFGGRRVTIGSWQLDLWEFSSTWAFREKIVRGDDWFDLTRTTFFTWDSIAMEYLRGNLYCPSDYFDKLRSGVLDINLEQNPNVVGAVVRSLRAIRTGRARIAPRLARYLLHKLVHMDNASVCMAERTGFSRPILTAPAVDYFRRTLDTHLATTPDEAYPPRASHVEWQEEWSQQALEF